MSSKPPASDRKRKPTTIPDTVSSNNGRNPKERKARRVSATNASASTAAFLQVDTPVVTENAATVNTASAATEDEVSIASIGKMIQDLFDSDNAKVNAALDALFKDLGEDEKKRESLVTAGGCLALILLLTKCLDKAIDGIPACDQVTELNELAELTTLLNTIIVIINLTHHHDESRLGITAIGGVEAAIKVMKTFPKCQTLQLDASGALRNLACCNVGKDNAIKLGGIEVLLAAINNHLGSSEVCDDACITLYNIAFGSKENTELLITLGGGAAVAKVRRKWPDKDEIQTWVRRLSNLFVAEWKAWGDEDEE
jgi:hypothetical protein